MKMKAKEYSSYIKGLIDGTNLDKTTPEGKVISALAELCDQMAAEIETLRDELDVANENIQELHEDLGAVEEVVYAVDDDCCDDDDCDCCDCDDDDDDEDGCGCGCCGHDDEDDDEEEFYVAMCPNCGGKVYFDDSVNLRSFRFDGDSAFCCFLRMRRIMTLNQRIIKFLLCTWASGKALF